MIKELLAALSIADFAVRGWEGDILGTMARLGEQAGCDMLLVTGDRDMYQLVTEHVNVVSTRGACRRGDHDARERGRSVSRHHAGARARLLWSEGRHVR
ncbi:MAG: hypothetical protein ACLU0O_05265 [Collinsella sp.]